MNLRTSQNSLGNGLTKTIKQSMKPMTKNKAKEIPELKIMHVLLQSLKYQLRDLKTINNSFDNLKSEKKGGLHQKKKRGEGENFLPEQGQNSELKG